MASQLYNLINPVITRPASTEAAHLKGQFVLLGVTEGPHLVHHVPQVLLHEAHGLAEPGPHRLPAVVAGLLVVVVVVVADAELERDVGPQPGVLDWFDL